MFHSRLERILINMNENVSIDPSEYDALEHIGLAPQLRVRIFTRSFGAERIHFTRVRETIRIGVKLGCHLIFRVRSLAQI